MSSKQVNEFVEIAEENSRRVKESFTPKQKEAVEQKFKELNKEFSKNNG